MVRDREPRVPPANDTHVGYGRPPKEHRFKAGKVGNPWGRRGKPKPKIDFLDEIVVVQVGGKPRRLTRDDTVDLALYRAAMAGNVSAAKELHKRRRERLANRPVTTTDDTLSPEDQAAFDRLIARRARGRQSPGAGTARAAPDDDADVDPADADERGGAV